VLRWVRPRQRRALAQPMRPWQGRSGGRRLPMLGRRSIRPHGVLPAPVRHPIRDEKGEAATDQETERHLGLPVAQEQARNIGRRPRAPGGTHAGGQWRGPLAQRCGRWWRQPVGHARRRGVAPRHRFVRCAAGMGPASPIRREGGGGGGRGRPQPRVGAGASHCRPGVARRPSGEREDGER